jgi:hypothetical protein
MNSWRTAARHVRWLVSVSTGNEDDALLRPSNQAVPTAWEFGGGAAIGT